ncbi:MAG: DUF6017 domain-containing protein [Eubacteriales bacterium]|nr:DUF6017 domain-containing protein [Eubacteriales bacterium]
MQNPNPFETGSPAVDKMSRLHISGNIIPVTWYKTIRKDTGKPNLNAIIILADVVYWYRAVEVRDELTGQLIGLKKKFHSDLLQRSYQQISDQFGISKRDATNAVVELEKIGVIRRVFRTLEIGGQLVPNVLFLELNVEILEQLTFLEQDAGSGRLQEKSRYPPEMKGVSPKWGRGITEISETVSPQSVRGTTQIRETNTETTNKEYDTQSPIISFQETVAGIKQQVAYDALKHDHPHDQRLDEIVGIIADIMVSTAGNIRVNKEDKPAEIVKAQFAKLDMQHIEYVLRCMEEANTKARNIRAVLITALYNSVNTISNYYENLVQYHMRCGIEEEVKEEN